MKTCGVCRFIYPVILKSVAEREHVQHHEWWESGIPLLTSMSKPEDGHMIVSAISSDADRKLAFQLDRLAQRETDSDRPPFPYPHRSGLEDCNQYNTTAHLAITDGKAIGYALTRWRNIWGLVDAIQNPYAWMTEPIRHEERRLCIDMVFVSARYRGQGIATSLIRFVARSNSVPVDHLVHTYPLSEPGLRLAKKFSVDGRYLVAVAI